MRKNSISQILSAGVLAAVMSAANVRADEAQEVTLTPDATGLKFAQITFTVKAGGKVKITFKNESPVPQPHNLLILAPGSINEVGALANQMLTDPEAMKKSYIPESDKILHSMALINPTETGNLEFEAPVEAGEYPYICTFPGHWMTMRGVMTVEK